MNGIDYMAYMQQVAQTMGELTDRKQIEIVLDELEYLFEVIPPEMQDSAEKLIKQLRDKLDSAE